MRFPPFLLGLLVLVACSSSEQKADALPLELLSVEEQHADLDLLLEALRSAHPGLYRYTTKASFDSSVAIQRAQLDKPMNALELYRILSAIVAATREDHCDISLPEHVRRVLSEHARPLPLLVRIVNGKPVITGTLPGDSLLIGRSITAINGTPIAPELQRIYNTFASDGGVISSKERAMDDWRFALERVRAIGSNKSYTLQLDGTDTYRLNGIRLDSLHLIVAAQLHNDLPEDPIALQFLEPGTALLSLNTFNNDAFTDIGLSFAELVDVAFATIAEEKTTDLIIDLRENGGGDEGNEDIVFSYLNSKPYRKYRSVEAMAYTYPFMRYTDLAHYEDSLTMISDLHEEFAVGSNGRLFRRPGIMPPAAPRSDAYNGRIWVLTSGWTYSGGAELASLLRQHTPAVFIGEEVGGAFGGNSSGYSLTLTLPHSGIQVEVPLVSFNLDVDVQDPARGVLPHYPVQPTPDDLLHKRDAVLEKARELIAKQRPSRAA